MTVLTILLLLFTTTTASPTSWTQGYLAEYYHQCEPGSFVDEQMKDAVFTPEIICADKETNNCETKLIDFNNNEPTCKAWRGTQCGFEGGFPDVKIPDAFSARYTGKLTPPVTGKYEFCLDSDDGSKLWIDGTMVADDNSIHGMGWPECGEIDLTVGIQVDLQVNYYENDGLAGLRLYWRLPETTEKDPVIVPASAFSHVTNGGKTSHTGLYGEYFRECHSHETIASLDLSRKQPVSHTVVKKREINYGYCEDYWCPDYVPPTPDGDKMPWDPSDECQEDPSIHESCVPYRDYFAMRLTGYLVLNGIPSGSDRMNCTFRLTSTDGANFYLGDNDTTPLVDHDGLHDWWDDRSSENSFTVYEKDIAVGARWQGGYIPFRLEYFNNADEHALILEMKGCHDLVTYQDFAPLRLTEFQIPTDTDVNATNPPDRQCQACNSDNAPSTVAGGCYPDGAKVDKSVVDEGRSMCLSAKKYLWCDQVPFPTSVADGRCDPENNVLGCWDGGDCCQATCTDGSKHQCPLQALAYPHCAATFMPGLDAEFYEDVSIGDVGTLVERTVVPNIWWPSNEGPMQYLNTSGIVKEWDHFYLRLSGFIHIPDAGQYTFYLAADDGATLYIDGDRVLDDTGIHGMKVEQSPMWLSGGFHQIQVNMQQKTGQRGLQLEVRGPSYLDPVIYRKQPVPASWLWNGNPCGDETSIGIDIPLDLRDLKVPRSPLCGGHGVCVPLCPKSSTHGACWNHTCNCDTGYQSVNGGGDNGTSSSIRNSSSSSSAGGSTRGGKLNGNVSIGCEAIPPRPPVPEKVNGWLIFVLVMLGIGLISCSICAYNRKELKQWALWKFASARLYKSMKPALDHDMENDVTDDRERMPRDGMQQNNGYEAAEI